MALRLAREAGGTLPPALAGRLGLLAGWGLAGWQALVWHAKRRGSETEQPPEVVWYVSLLAWCPAVTTDMWRSLVVSWMLRMPQKLPTVASRWGKTGGCDGSYGGLLGDEM